MGTVQNITAADLEVPLINRTVKAGETVDVDDRFLDPAVNLWPAASWLVNGASHEPDAPVEAAPAPATPAPTVTDTPAEPVQS